MSSLVQLWTPPLRSPSTLRGTTLTVLFDAPTVSAHTRLCSSPRVLSSYRTKGTLHLPLLLDLSIFLVRHLYFCYPSCAGPDGPEATLSLVVRDGVAGKGGLATSSRFVRGPGRVPWGVHLRRG